ncbi:MAG: excinuclease ABC subunit UvrA, partial [Bacteroidales bacterium]|nr:excinuclease ABC subunit UvrA [Bacteroidales bacterium]
PISGQEVKKDDIQDIIRLVEKLPEETKFFVVIPIVSKDEKDFLAQLEIFGQKGLSRIEYGSQLFDISDILNEQTKCNNFKKANLLIDRLVYRNNGELISRLTDSLETAFAIGNGICKLKYFGQNKWTEKQFSNRFELDGIQFQEPSFHFFSYNNPLGACPVCEGYGKVMGFDEELIFPSKNLSIFEDAIAPWRGNTMQEYKDQLIDNASKFNFPIHRPIKDLTKEQYKLLWTGNKHFHGLNDFFKMLEENKYKIQYRVMLSRFRGKTICPECGGTRLRKEVGYVKISNKAIQELLDIELKTLYDLITHLKLNKTEKEISNKIIFEITNRLKILLDVGLDYLTLNRLTNTLSGGEAQRIRLSNSIGSSLVGSLYILDEPSIGLHLRDNQRLIKVLKNLRDLGNTVVVVEHDEEIIRSADFVVDMGPHAGQFGGEVIFSGNQKDLSKADTLTGKYLSGKMQISIPETRRRWNNYIAVTGAEAHNLKLANETVKFPLNILTVITGVSGSGKSTLLNNVFYAGLMKHFGNPVPDSGKYKKMEGDLHLIKQVEYVNQKPIGKSSRSNPATYIKAWDNIRLLFASQKKARFNGLKPAHFSFNVEGGRCETCKGDGVIKIDMQFMADVYLVCDTCEGKRFKDEILEVTYRGKNIYDILEMTIAEAIVFFGEDKENKTAQNIVRKLKYLELVGLDYLHIGQSSATLSGGESQRIKLAFFLSRENNDHTIFLFDEPTTGLHFHDINKLLKAFENLLTRGNTVIVIEHNPEVIAHADWLIDLGPEGGNAGGEIVAQGTPETIAKCKSSYTGKYLKAFLKNKVKNS